MREIFVAYATYKSPLAFPICRAINGFLFVVQCLMFNHGFSDQHLVLLNWNWAHNWGNFKERLMHHEQEASSHLVPLDDVEAMNT